MPHIFKQIFREVEYTLSQILSSSIAMNYRIRISESTENFVKSKYKYVQAYANTSNLDDQKKEIFKIKSRLTGIKDTDLLFYLSVNFFKVITHIYSKYEIGSTGVVVDFMDKALNKKIIDFSDKVGLGAILIDVINKKSIVGYSVIRIKVDEDGNPIIQKIPTPNYYVDTQGLDIGSTWKDITKHYIINIESVKDGKNYKKYAHVDRYEKTDRGWKGIYEKYIYKGSLQFAEEDLVEIKKEEELTELPLFVFQNEVFLDEEIMNATGTTRLYFAESDYDDIFSIVEEINDRFSQISVELIQNLRSKMSVPASYGQAKNLSNAINKKRENLGLNHRDERNKLFDTNNGDFDRILHSAGEQPAHYITKDNPMIDQALTTIEQYVRILSALTDIPLSLFAVNEAAGNKKVGVDNNEFDSFYTKIAQRRVRIYPTLQRMYAYIGYILNGGDKPSLPTIKFEKLKSRDTKDKVEYLSTMYGDGVLSKATYIETALNYDLEEVTEELKKIAFQEIQQQHIAGDLLPSLSLNNDE